MPKRNPSDITFHPTLPGVCRIHLATGDIALIDAVDVPLVEGKCWRSFRAKGGGCFYVRTTERIRGTKKLRTISLHRFLMNPGPGLDTDHANGDGLDNRRSNLRICTRAQNRWNSWSVGGSTSAFKGVCRRKRGGMRWQAKIQVGDKKYSKIFVWEVDAALWYDQMAREFHGEFAKTNTQMLPRLIEERLAVIRAMPVEPAPPHGGLRGPRTPYGKSRYRGLAWQARNKRWVALICHRGKRMYAGSSKDEVTAAKLYDKKARELGRSSETLNFP